MPRESPTRSRDTDDLREIVREEIVRSLRDQEWRDGTSRPAVNGRAADTLRRDIGILAILLAMMAQTGMGFYWAGGISRSADSLREEVKQVSSEQAYTRAQLQLLDGQLKEMKGKQDERDRHEVRK